MAFHLSVRSSAIGALLLAAGCASGAGTGGDPELAGGSGSGSGSGVGVSKLVSVTDLTSDQPGLAPSADSSLVNAWGIVGYQGWFWISDNATGKLSIFDGAGHMAGAQQGQGSGSGQGQGSVNVASDSINLGEGITGIAVNDSTAMQMQGTGANAQACGPANLIVASEKGQLIGVNTSLNMTGGQVLVDRSKVAADYTGVAVLDVHVGATCSATGGTSDNGQGMGSGSSAGAGSGSGSGQSGTGGMGNVPQPGVLVLAADFHNARIDVFDESFQLVAAPMFSTPASIRAGFAPFNVAVVNGIVYVTYAQQNSEMTDSVAGPGLGFVVAFDLCGNVLWTSNGVEFNAPWGMALGGDLSLAPGVLLVGNFGDGHITEVNPKDGTVLDQLMTADNAPVVIDGLWGLAIGIGVQNAQPGGVYFASGPQDEAHGMFGVIAPAATTGPGPGSGSGM
jgi:hypothetical protein